MAQESTNHFYYPKGYALCIGINDYSKTAYGNLDACLTDVDYWNTKFKNKWSYDLVYTMKDSEATAGSIYAGIWCMAAVAEPGDIVAITFSGHGEWNASSGVNTIASYDGVEMPDYVFTILLKAFKPKVRVVFITDACQSGSFVEPSIDTYANLKDKEVQHLVNEIKKVFPYDETKLMNLLNKQKEIKISAAVGHMGAIYDAGFVPDGITVDYTKKMGWDLSWYELEEWRTELNDMYREAFYQDKIEIYKFIDHAIAYSLDPKPMSNFRNKWMTKFSSYSTYYMVQSVLQSNDTTIVSFLKEFIATPVTYSNSEFQKQLNRIKLRVFEIKRRADSYIPIVNFSGYKSNAFRHQYVFTKFSRAFYNENGV